MRKTILHIFAAGLVAAVLTGCAAKKAATDVAQKSAQTGVAQSKASREALALAFTQKVADNAVYAQNIVGSISLNIKAGDKDLSAPGSLHMRKDKVIRIQVFMPLLGTELARLEFTPDHVLVVDRIHKEYIEGNYNQLDFLKENGLSFYSLQSLFWNQLFLPGQQKVSEGTLKSFDVQPDVTAANLPVTLKNGNMTYQWTAEQSTGRITRTDVTYESSHHGTSKLMWQYTDFRPVGVKMFPARQSFTFSTTATSKRQQATVTLKMSDISTDSKWDDTTKLSGKYTKKDVNDVLDKILDL